MATLPQIYDWFMTGKKPTQAQFWEAWGSFRHKEEAIPQSAVSNLENTLNAKAEKSQYDAHLIDPDAHADLLLGKEDKSKKGAPDGYVGLNEFSKIAHQFLSIVNNLTTGGATSILSAEQGLVLQTQIDAIKTILTSDDINLDTVQELVDAIKTVETSLETILVNDLTTGGATKALTAEMGKTLKELISAVETFTEQKVRDTALTGLQVPSATGSWTILAEDKLITALAKIQFFINQIRIDVNLRVRKVDLKWVPYTGTGAPVVLPNNSDDKNFDIRGGVTEILGYSSSSSYSGLIFSIKNTQQTSITLRHMSSSDLQIRFFFQNNLDYILKPGHIARFSYVGTGPLGENSGHLWFTGQLDNVNSLDYTFFTQVYGIQRDLTIAAPEWTRIGNMELHASLPVHSLIRRCLVTDAGAVTYLNSENSALKTDGSAADLTGAAGQVMVEIPEYYRRFTQDGNIQTILYSLSTFTGAEKIPKKYVSAFKATVERATSKLASVVNTTAAFRGGDNNSALDAAANTQLGKPASNISRTSFETFGANRGLNWTNMDYQVRKDIYWLIVAEYATSNHQAAFSSVKTVEGYRQGALGDGPTDIHSGNWSTFNGYNPLFNCGTTLALGNNTGVNAITLNDFPTAGLSKATRTISYRGLENIFGDIWEWTSGINIKTNNGSAVVFIKNNKALNSNVDYFSYRPVGSTPISNGYISKIIFGAEGDIMPKEANGSATTYFSDYYYQSSPAVETLRGVLFGGDANDGSGAGSAYSGSDLVPSSADASFGSRLCFLP